MKKYLFAASIVLALAVGSTAHAAFIFTSGTLTTGVQTFDSLPAPAAGSNGAGSLPANWLSNAGNLQFRGITEVGGSASTNRWLSLHEAAVTGAGDKALGTGTTNNPGYLGIALTNSTGQTISSLKLTYTSELWIQSNTAQGWTVEYQVGVSSVTAAGTWTAISAWTTSKIVAGTGSINGNLIANQSTINDVSGSISGWTTGTDVTLRWIRNGTGGSIGIDNVTITAVPEPTSLSLLGLGAAGLLLRRRKTA